MATTIKGVSATSGQRVAKIKDIVKTLIDSHFPSTLAREPDIINVVNALCFLESSYNYNAVGGVVSSTPHTGGGIYLSSSAVSAVMNNPSSTPTQKSNILQGLTALGVMQVMGHNFVKGGTPSGKSELERLRPDIASTLVVNPGDDIRASVLGESNLQKAILAGLIILEGKYRSVNQTGSYFSIKADPYARKFSSRLQGAVAAYLGLGKQDKNGTTPENYANQILGGSIYAQANGKGSIYVRDTDLNLALASTPSTNGSSMHTLGPAGC